MADDPVAQKGVKDLKDRLDKFGKKKMKLEDIVEDLAGNVASQHDQFSHLFDAVNEKVDGVDAKIEKLIQELRADLLGQIDALLKPNAAVGITDVLKTGDEIGRLSEGNQKGTTAFVAPYAAAIKSTPYHEPARMVFYPDGTPTSVGNGDNAATVSLDDNGVLTIKSGPKNGQRYAFVILKTRGATA